MSKAALLTRSKLNIDACFFRFRPLTHIFSLTAVQQIQHLKNMQNELLAEVERLVQENETLKK